MPEAMLARAIVQDEDEKARSPGIAALLKSAIGRLRDAGVATPSLDARILLGHATGLSQAELIAGREELATPRQCRNFQELIEQRIARRPVSRILGRRAFADMELILSDAVLDPRRDSETLLGAIASERAEAHFAGRGRLNILDLGTGSGALLLALLRMEPDAIGIGLDISPPALEVAERNAVAVGVADQVTWLRSNWFDAIEGGSSRGEATFDLIIANPPYIRRGDLEYLDPEVRDHDPLLALDGGCDGLDGYRAIAAKIHRFLAPDGLCAFEIGAGQGDAVAAILEGRGLRLLRRTHRSRYDLAGHERCILAAHSR